jgi:hypothetical protein
MEPSWKGRMTLEDVNTFRPFNKPSGTYPRLALDTGGADVLCKTEGDVDPGLRSFRPYFESKDLTREYLPDATWRR